MPQLRPAALAHFPGALGDLLLALPALLALARRTPGGIALATPGSRHELLGLLPGITPLHPESLPLHRAYGGAALSGWSTVWLPHRDPAPPASGSVRWYAVPPPRARGGPHAAQRYLDAICPGAPLEPLRFALSDELRERGRRIVVRLGLQPGCFVALHPGAGAEDKRWGGWDELAGALDRTLVLAGPVELERCTPLPPGPRLVAPSLGELAGVLACCAAFAGNDSGPAHLAAALGVSTVAVFVSTDPSVWGPASHCARSLVEPPVSLVKSRLLAGRGDPR